MHRLEVQPAAFSKAEKARISSGQEIAEDGLVWRKLKNGGGVWRYDFRHSGQRYKGQIGREADGITLSAARHKLTQVRSSIVLGITSSSIGKGHPSLRGGATFKTAADDFLEWSKARHIDWEHNEARLRIHLLPEFGHRQLADITSLDIEELRLDLARQVKSSSTIDRVVALISSVFEHARNKGLIQSNPARGLKKLRKKEIEKIFTFTEPQIATLLEAARQVSTTAEVIVALGCMAGLRASEALGLDWTNVFLEEGTLKICQTSHKGKLRGTTKSGKARIVPIHAGLREILLRHRQCTRGEGLVLNNNGLPYFQIQHQFTKLKALAALTDAPSYHALRHTFATTAIVSGVDLPTVQQWLGHSDVSTTMRYCHINKEHSQAMMERVRIRAEGINSTLSMSESVQG